MPRPLSDRRCAARQLAEGQGQGGLAAAIGAGPGKRALLGLVEMPRDDRQRITSAGLADISRECVGFRKIGFQLDRALELPIYVDAQRLVTCHMRA